MSDTAHNSAEPSAALSNGSVAGVQKRLKKAINSVLQANARLPELVAAQAQALAVVSDVTDERTALLLPTTSDTTKVEQYLSEHDRLTRLYSQCAGTYAAARNEMLIAQCAIDEAVEQLSDLVSSVADNPELQGDEVLLAANYLLGIALRYGATLPPDTVEEEIVPLTPEEQGLIARLKDATEQTAVLFARAFELAQEISAAQEALRLNAKPDVQRPVRPTDEEIKRYLCGVEAATIARQEAHRHWVRLDAQCQQHRSTLEAAHAEMEAVLGEAKSLVDRDEDAAAQVACTHAVRALHEAACRDLVCHDQGRLDSVDLPNASAKEGRQIEELRKVMRKLALNFALYNESNSAWSAAQAVPEVKVELKGITVATTWNECLRWRAQKAEAEVQAQRQNDARQTRIDLLSQSTVQHQENMQETALELRRCVASFNEGGHPPCNELRAVLNAAAWMYTANDIPKPKRAEGEFPRY